MNAEKILITLRTADALPREALAEAPRHAAELAPKILEVTEKFANGVFLIPEQEQLLFYGLHVLATAENSLVYAVALNMLATDTERLDRIFSDHVAESFIRILAKTYDDDRDQIFASLASDVIRDTARWILFDAMTFLTWQGRISADRTKEFLERFEAEGLAEENDAGWQGWEDAVVYLGLLELQPALRRVWSKSAFDHHRDIDRDEALQIMKDAAANPNDPSHLIADRIMPVDDLVEALDWVDRVNEPVDGQKDRLDTDPAKDIRLSEEEFDWLSGFLESAHVPDRAMDLEMLDGFFAALIVGPEAVLPSEWLPEVWGEEGEEPEFESIEQTEFVMGLVMRHWNTIAKRIEMGYLHEPILKPFTDALRGRDWGQGFVLGYSLRDDKWISLLKDRQHGALVPSIFALARNDPELFGEPITPKFRADVLAALPSMLLTAASCFRSSKSRRNIQPLRSAKIGRNKPCPCGSGKKYKHCCGSVGGSSLH